MENQTFKRNKSKYQNEAAALKAVCEAENVGAEHLTAKHTAKMFVWLVDPSKAGEKPTGVSYAKSEYSESDAIAQAMIDLNTFQGNLKPAHDEEYFAFSKVR